MVTQKKLAEVKLSEYPAGDGRFNVTALKELAEQQVRFAPPARRQGNAYCLFTQENGLSLIEISCAC